LSVVIIGVDVCYLFDCQLQIYKINLYDTTFKTSFLSRTQVISLLNKINIRIARPNDFRSLGRAFLYLYLFDVN